MPVKGLQQTLRALNSMKVEIQEDVKDVVEEYTLKIQRQAMDNAPSAGEMVATQHGPEKNLTNIQQFIFSRLENEGYRGVVGIEENASEFAIFLEFGTGVSAAGYVPQLPPEFQAVAQKYYKNGKGTLIKAPFLLPAYFSNRMPFLKALKSTLKSHGVESVLIP